MRRLKNFIIAGVLIMTMFALPVNTNAKDVENTKTEATYATYAVVENGERCLATTNTAEKAKKLVEINKDYCENLTIIKFDQPIKEMTLEKVEESL